MDFREKNIMNQQKQLTRKEEIKQRLLHKLANRNRKKLNIKISEEDIEKSIRQQLRQ